MRRQELAVNNPLVVAEIGSNWKKYDDTKSCLNIALKQIEAASYCGFNAVKFQYFTPNCLYGQQMADTRFCLPKEFLPYLASFAKNHNMEFLCSAFSLEGYKTINEFVNWHKVALPEAEVAEYHDYIISTKKPVIISMDRFTNKKSIYSLYNRSAIDRFHYLPVSCVSEYPAKPEDYNLIETTGVSDHTRSNIFARLGKNMDFMIYEVHVDLHIPHDIEISSPDVSVSITREAAMVYCENIRKEAKPQPCRYKRIKTDKGWIRPNVS